VEPSPGDTAAVRFDIGVAGLDPKTDIARLCDKFKQPDGRPTRDRAKTEQMTVSGTEVHLLDVSGTYRSQPTMSPRENYRMLAAIVVRGEQGYALRLFGPKQSIADQEAAFRAMLGTLRTN
jgi:hypothetical protein